MRVLELANELLSLVKNDSENDLIKLTNHAIRQLNAVSEIESKICRLYEEDIIIPKLESLIKKLNKNSTGGLEKFYFDFIKLYSSIEHLYFAYISQVPLVENMKKEFDAKMGGFEEEFAKYEDTFERKLESIQKLLGNAQTNASSIETVKDNMGAIDVKTTQLLEEYKQSKENYIAQNDEYTKLISNIEEKDVKLDEILKHHSSKLSLRETELQAQKEKINSILGDANRASMAQSFIERKRELSMPIENTAKWRNWGLILIALLIFIILCIEWTQDTFDYYRFFSRLPVVMPLIWLVWSNSQRNNHLTQIQEEYSYKAAIAMAFEGYQRKVSELEDIELEKLLLELSVRNLGDNPVKLFEKQMKSSPFEDSTLGKLLEKIMKDSKPDNKS